MPRKARIDASGPLHHIIVRGIERREIFYDDEDREAFVARFGEVLSQTHTDCFAWALMPNHAHYLLRTSLAPISTVMRRLLTGYAVQFNWGYGFDWLVDQMARLFNLERDIVTRPGRYPDTVEARGVLCYWAVRELGLTILELSKRLGVSQPTISQSVKRGEGIVKRKDLKISE